MKLTIEVTPDPACVLEQLHPYILESYAEMYPDSVAEDEATYVSPRIFDKGAGQLYVATYGEEIVGTAGWTWLEGPDKPSSFPEHTAEIKRLFVKKEFRGQHIGSRLITTRFEGMWEAGVQLAVGETGGPQLTSRTIRLDPKNGYVEIEPFGAFKDNPDSLFFGKWRP